MLETNGALAARIGTPDPAIVSPPGNITLPPPGPPPVVTPLLAVTVLSPNGGTLTPGQTVTIQWQSTGATSQSVKYTLDGANYIDIINDLPGSAQSTQWTVPQASTTAARVRVAVRDAAGNRVTDDSDNPITIQPAAAPMIASVSPTSGPTAGGNQVVIGGANFRQGCTVRFGGTDGQVVSVTPTQVVVIAPTQVVAGVVNIRLVNPDGEFVVATNAYTYTAVALTVRVIAPNGGERFAPGQIVTIQWQPTGAVNQSVKYTLDGATYIDIINDLPGSATSTQWIVPQASTTTARVRVAVRDAAGNRVTDDSDNPIMIQPIDTAPAITSVAPASGPASGGTTVTIGGRNFQAGCTVRFDGLDAQVVSVTSTQVVVRTPVANPGATVVSIRLINPDGQFVAAAGAYTYIAIPLTVKVLSPNGGALQVGQLVTIQWQSSGAVNQSVKYTLDGATYIDIINDLPGSAQSTQWIVPQANTSTARVRVAIRDAQGNRVTDDSDAPITIIPVDTKPAITSVAPISGPANGGTTVTITGRNFQGGCIVRFDGIDAQVMSVSSTQVVVRTPIANPGATLVNIRLVNPDGQFVVAEGAYRYVATPLAVKVLSPNGGSLTSGQIVTIQWSSTGATLQSVKYTLDGANYIDIANDLPGTAQSTQWIVPQASTTTARVRVAVRDAQGNRVTDDSDNPITIQGIAGQPSITSVAPASGPATGGTVVTITGQNFRAGCTVRFGGLPGTVLSVTAMQITVRTPASAPGLVDVRVTNADGGSAVRTGGFRFTTTQMQASPQVRSMQVVDPDGIDPAEQFVTTATTGTVNAGKILVVELYYITIPPDLNLSFSLFALNAPPGVQVGFSPNPMSYATIYMTITTELTATPGTYPITIAGEGDAEGVFVFPFDFLLRVDPPIPRVKITATNPAPEVTPGGFVPVPLVIDRKNFPGPVTLTANGVSFGGGGGLPDGIQVAFVPQPADANASTVNFAADLRAIPGDYPIVISAEKKDGLVKVGEASILLRVKSSGTLELFVTEQVQVPVLGCAKYMVTLKPGGGLRGKVDLSIANLMSGIDPMFMPQEIDLDLVSPQSVLTLKPGKMIGEGTYTFDVSAATKDGNVKAGPVRSTLIVRGLPTVTVKPKTPDTMKVLPGGTATFRLTFDRAQPGDCMQMFMKDLQAVLLDSEPLEPGFKQPRIVNDGLNGGDIVIEVDTTAEAKGSETFRIGAKRPNMAMDVTVVPAMITVEIGTASITILDPTAGKQFQGFQSETFRWQTEGMVARFRFDLMVEGVAMTISQDVFPVAGNNITSLTLDLPNPAGATVSPHEATVRITGLDSTGRTLTMAEQSFTVLRTGTPFIVEIRPPHANRGTDIDIIGTSFVPMKTRVFFTTLRGSLTEVDADVMVGVITVIIPDDAIDGNITVRNDFLDRGDMQDVTAKFFVDDDGNPVSVVAAPRITSFSPLQGPAGTRLQIVGTNFVKVSGVTVNGTPAQFQVVSASIITAVVPAGARTGPVTVATAAGISRSAVFFQVTSLPGGTIGGPIIGGGLGGRLQGAIGPDQGLDF